MHYAFRIYLNIWLILYDLYVTQFLFPNIPRVKWLLNTVFLFVWITWRSDRFFFTCGCNTSYRTLTAICRTSIILTIKFVKYSLYGINSERRAILLFLLYNSESIPQWQHTFYSSLNICSFTFIHKLLLLMMPLNHT